MGKDPESTSTGVTRESETVATNELERIVLKGNPAQPLGRQAVSSGTDVKTMSKQTNPLRLYV